MKIRRLSDAFVAASEVRDILDRENIPFTPVNQVNWPAYPYLPEVAVRMALGNDALLIHYRVSEQAVLARYVTDGDRVWTDSCVETFIRPDGANGYYNIECSCIGTLLIGYGEGREGREPLSTGLLGTADRWSSLGRRPLGLVNSPTTWELALALPYTLFGEHAHQVSSVRFRFNVYKCGDDLPTPHFVSLFPIDVPEPDFHRPDFFGKPE
jgi:hypothetical protein